MRICKYFGGKGGSIARWIGSQLPSHSTYVEPFGGMASVLLNKRKSSREIYNDLNPVCCNMMMMLQKFPTILIDTINNKLEDSGSEDFSEWVKQNPRLDYGGSVFEFYGSEEYHERLESAAHFYLHSQYSFMGGGLRWSSGLSPSAKRPDPAHLYRVYERVKFVELMSIDAIALISSLPKDSSILLYVDPPYLNEARKSKDARAKNQSKSLTRRQYAYELAEEQHQELAIALQGRSVVLSGYRSDLYQELYQGWDVRSLRWAGDTEYLWVSPEAIGLVSQLQLF